MHAHSNHLDSPHLPYNCCACEHFTPTPNRCELVDTTMDQWESRQHSRSAHITLRPFLFLSFPLPLTVLQLDWISLASLISSLILKKDLLAVEKLASYV